MPNPFRQQAIDGLKQGDQFIYRRRFTQDLTTEFGDLTRDYNPVHYDSRWSEQKGFNDLICHGLLVGSMICELGGQVGWLATGMDFRFIKPVYFGDTIECQITIKKVENSGRAEAEALFYNQNGQQVCYAYLSGRLPIDSERELLNRMVGEGDPTNQLSNETYPSKD